MKMHRLLLIRNPFLWKVKDCHSHPIRQQSRCITWYLILSTWCMLFTLCLPSSSSPTTFCYPSTIFVSTNIFISKKYNWHAIDGIPLRTDEAFITRFQVVVSKSDKIINITTRLEIFRVISIRLFCWKTSNILTYKPLSQQTNNGKCVSLRSPKYPTCHFVGDLRVDISQCNSKLYRLQHLHQSTHRQSNCIVGWVVCNSRYRLWVPREYNTKHTLMNILKYSIKK